MSCSEGGNIFIGTTYSFGCCKRFYVVKIDSNGIEDSTYVSDGEWDWGLAETPDSGFMLVGSSESHSNGGDDVYIIKIDQNFTEVFNKHYGGGADEYGRVIVPAIDDGYIIGGDKRTPDRDLYVLKIDDNADTIWTRQYGGSGDEQVWDIEYTRDGDYFFLGYTSSIGSGGQDIYLLKVNTIGDTIWTQTYGGVNDEVGWAIKQSSDEGYIIAGYTTSFGAGGADIYLLKIDENGNVIWANTYGGSEDDIAYSIEIKNDVCIVVGETQSFGSGGKDIYVLFVDQFGNSFCEETYGGEFDDVAFASTTDANGETIIAGSTILSDSAAPDAFTMSIDPHGCEFIIGDVNGSDSYNGLDITYGVAYLKGGNPPECIECGWCPAWHYCGDVNGSCSYNGLDITYGVAFFKGGDPPIYECECTPGNTWFSVAAS